MLYSTDNEVGAYVEVLQDLRPRGATQDLLAAIEDDGDFGDTLATIEAAARERLRQYHFAALIPAENEFVVDVASAGSRTEIERRLKDDLGGRRVKRGDLSASDYDFTRRVSRLVYATASDDDGKEAVGLAAASAEHGPTTCFAYFETGRDTNELRGGLFLHFVRQALDEEAFLMEALNHITGPA